MKARFSGNGRGGFITLEIMIAFAVAALMFVAAMSSDRSTAYWAQSTQTGSAALLSANADLAAARAKANQDFFQTASSFAPDDAACTGGACDGVRRTVTDVSACAKEVETRAERHVIGYPLQTTTLTASLVDPVQEVALGGDCDLSVPNGDWTKPLLQEGVTFGPGNPTGIDVLHGVAYLTFDAAPYLRIAAAGGAITFADGFRGSGPYNAIDVVDDAASGRIYAYVAAVSPQLQIIDVTDPQSPHLVGSATLAGVTLTGTQAQAWRIFVYGRTVYVFARYMLAPNPELHMFDVGDPSRPFEIGGGYKMNTSVYDVIVRDQLIAGTKRRLAYLATTFPSGELRVLDITDPTHVIVMTSCDLPGNEQATSLFLSGTTLYVGRDTVPNGGADLYAFDASDPTSTAFCKPLGTADVNSDSYSRHVQALRASGPSLFVATSNTTDAHGQLQIRNADPTTNFALLATYPMPSLIETGLDFDGNALYAAGTAAPQLQVIIPSP